MSSERIETNQKRVRDQSQNDRMRDNRRDNRRGGRQGNAPYRRNAPRRAVPPRESEGVLNVPGMARAREVASSHATYWETKSEMKVRAKGTAVGSAIEVAQAMRVLRDLYMQVTIGTSENNGRPMSEYQTNPRQIASIEIILSIQEPQNPVGSVVPPMTQDEKDEYLATYKQKE